MITLLKARFNYFKEKKAKLYLLILLFIVCALILVFGCLLLKALPENRNLSMGDIFWESLRLFMDPGGFLGSKLSLITTLVTCFIVFLGMIAFTGGAVGYVTNLISEQMEDTKKGVKRVDLFRVSLFLYWNDRAKSIIFDRIRDKKIDNNNSYIVILAPFEDKEEFERKLNQEMKIYKKSLKESNKHLPKIVVRNGNPQNVADLEKVGLFFSRRIFVFRPEQFDNPDYEVMKTFMAICKRASLESDELEVKTPEDIGEDVDLETIVLETADSLIAKAIREYKIITDGSFAYTSKTVSGKFVLGKIFGLLALMPELSGTISELVSSAGSTLDTAGLEDKDSIETELLRYGYRIPLFSFKHNLEQELEEYDSKQEIAVYLQGGGEDSSYDDPLEDYTDDGKTISIKGDLSFDTHKILIYGINGKTEFILNSIKANNNEYPDRKCFVKLIVNKEDIEKAQELLAKDDYSNFIDSEIVILNDNFSTDYVKEIDDDFHSMLILSSDSESENERDRNVFERWITLSSFLDKEKTYADIVKGKIILEIKDIDNASIITNDYNRQVIVSNKMVGLIMAMLSEEDDFLEILMDAIGSKGDTDYIDNNILNHDAGDILSVRADAFIEDLSTVYKSKHDLINKIYKATDGEFVIMGIYVEGKTILFTNGCKCGMSLGLPDLSDAILISGDKERINLSDDDNELTLRESDYLILARNTSKL